VRPLAGVRALLLDLDGTVYQSGRLIPGAAEALAALSARGIPHCFVTNTSSRPRPALVRELSEMGLPSESESEVERTKQRIQEGVRSRLEEAGVALFLPEMIGRARRRQIRRVAQDDERSTRARFPGRGRRLLLRALVVRLAVRVAESALPRRSITSNRDHSESLHSDLERPAQRARVAGKASREEAAPSPSGFGLGLVNRK